MAKKDMTDIRGLIQFLKQENDIIIVRAPVDPIYEVAGIQVALDDGPAFLFENIKGYPGVTSIGNVFSRMDRVAKMFDVDDPRNFKFRCVDAIRHPIPPVVVDAAPCQEVVMTKGFDVPALLPIPKSTPKDGARVMGSGIWLISGRYANDGHEVAFKRMNFRGKDWASLTASPGTHGEAILFMHCRDEDVPVTINICPSPAVTLVAAGGLLHSIIPFGADELAIAGGLEGSPIEICKAKTVDAYSIAKAEWVIEGVMSTEKVWETEEAEKLGKQDVAPFFPEWTGTLGKAWKSRKFQATAITHRKNPVFYNWLGGTMDMLGGMPFREACFYEAADRLVPGMVRDVNIPFALKHLGGVIYQVEKRRPRDEGYQRNILAHALSLQPGLRLVVAVDEDVDIYSMDDVMWAIMSRVNPTCDLLLGASGSRGVAAQPGEQTGRVETPGFAGGLAIDATVPFLSKERYERAHFPVEGIDLTNWFTQTEINTIKAKQSEYAKVLAKKGW